ncbi:MAG: hypothetical protein AAFY71_26155 [Bacteroidota bacterium]
MNKYIWISFVLLFTLIGLSIQGISQPFYAAQTAGLHTIYFSLSVRERPYVGVGYNLHTSNSPINEWGFEWQVPLNDPFRAEQQRIVAGFYRTNRLNSRPFIGYGLHARYEKDKEGAKNHSSLSLAATAMPSYTYSASLDGGLYGTMGGRITYVATLAEKTEGDASWTSLPKHGVELGGHIDAFFDRSGGFSVNILNTKNWKLKNGDEEDESDWNLQGDVYVGSTYFIARF